MNIEFNRTESEQVLELIYLADWMANGIHPEEGHAAYAAVIQKIYAAAEEQGLGFLVETNPDSGDMLASEALESRIDAADTIGHYDDHVFWDELSLRLAERDLRREMGETAFSAMRPVERDEKVDERAAVYDKEFDKHGLDRIEIDGLDPKRKRDGLTDKIKKLFDDGN